MYFQSQSLNLDHLTFDDSKIQKQTLSTNFFIYQNNDNLNKEQVQISYKFTEGPHTKLISDRVDPYNSLEQQLDELCLRFSKIKNIFIKHSQQQLSAHQKRLNLKSMTVNWQHVQQDVNNKIMILQSLEEYVDQLQKQEIMDYQQIENVLENKFQQYYLQRHYGSLKCQFHQLNINQKDQNGCSDLSNDPVNIELQKMQQEEQLKMIEDNIKSFNKQHKSSLNLYSSKSTLENDGYKRQNTLETIQNNHRNTKGSHNILIDDSKEQYENEFSQQFKQYEVFYEVPAFIEVQIPIIIYKEVIIQKQIMAKENNEQQYNIDDLSELDQIINKFSIPYQQIYLNAKQHQQDLNFLTFHNKVAKPNEIISQISKQDSHMQMKNQIGSIMLNSRVNEGKISKKNSLELFFGESKDQQDYKLQLDSNLKQPQSLMRDLYQQPLSDQRLDRPPTDRSMKYSQKIQITQKIDDKQQIIQNYLQSQRFLMSENSELNQKIQHYKAKLLIQQNKNRQLEQLARQLTFKLEEQLEYVEKITQKLQYFQIQQYQQKILYLTNEINLRQQKQEQFESKINEYEQQLKTSKMKEDKLKNEIQKAQVQLLLKQQQLQQIMKMCKQKQQQLKYFQQQQINILQKINQKKQQLFQQILNKQQQNYKLKQKLYQYQKFIQQEGIIMKFQDLLSIKSNIQQKQNNFHQQKQILSKIIQNKSKQYQNIIKQIQKQLFLQKQNNNNLLNQIQIIKQENKYIKQQFYIKNKQNNQTAMELVKIINKMKKQKEEYLIQFQSLLNQYDLQLMERNQQLIQIKQAYRLKQNDNQRQYSSKIENNIQNNNYKQLYEMISKDYQKLKQQKLSQKMMRQNHQDYLLNELSKYKKINIRLKRYANTLQQDLICVNILDKCQYHQLLIKHLKQQKQYYIQLLSGSGERSIEKQQ